MIPDYGNFIHPYDKTALNQLEGKPFIKPIFQAVMKLLDEKQMRLNNLLTKIKLGPEQLPEIYGKLKRICVRLNIQEPDFFLEMNPAVKSYTLGDAHPFIVITSGLMEAMTPEELETVIAYECGHIFCKHVLYHTVGVELVRRGHGFPLIPDVAVNVVATAFNAWFRYSALSCDRVAAYVMGDYRPVVSAMIRLAGGGVATTAKVNVEQYYRQLAVYDKIDMSMLDSLMQFWDQMDLDHPFPGIRALEIRKWVQKNPALFAEHP